MEGVTNKLRELEEKCNIKLEDLQKDEAFIDTVLYASQIAIRNSQKEKLTALHNAIANTALSQAPELAA